MIQGTVIDGAELLQAQLDSLIEENKDLLNRIIVLTRKNLLTVEGVKKNLGIVGMKYQIGRTELDEGSITIVLDGHPRALLLRAKDVWSFSAFQKKVLALTGKFLPNVNKTVWEIFLMDHFKGEFNLE